MLISGRLFENQTNEEKELWIKAVHQACRIPFVKIQQPKDTAGEYALAIEKWQLLFPDIPEVIQLLYDFHSRSRPLQKQLETWILAGNIVRFLRANTEALTVSDLGARFCGDSKALRGGELITIVTDWLTFMDTGIKMSSGEIDTQYRKTIRRETLERHSIVENRCSVAVTVFGPIAFEKAGKRINYVKNMWKKGESALLSLENLDDMSKIELPDNCPIYTCENESPYANMVRKGHPGLIIYTRGFPNTAVCKLYRLIVSQYPENSRFHWGDTDFAGLQIAAILHKIAPLRLWRCDIITIEKNQTLLIPVDYKEKERIQKFLNNSTDFPFREELEQTLKYGWLEQERYEL